MVIRNKLCNFAFRILKYMEERTDNGYSHVLKYTSLFGGVQGFIILIGLVRNWAMARLLGAGGLGLNSLLTSMQNFASQCTNFGISFGAVPRLSEFHEQQETQKLLYYIQVTRLWSLIAAALGFLFCVAISPLINGLSFTWGNHTYHYAMLAIAVATSAIAGGEVVVLKATRRLGALAKIQIYNVLISVVVSIPLYYFFYHSGVVPAIVLIAATNMLLTIAYSYRCYPLRLDFNRSMLRDGADMIRLGLAYVLAAAIGSATEMLIRSYLNVEGNLDDVGLYSAGFMITITYAGMVFSAMETDYFPRLSAVAHDIQATNETVNKQTEVSLLMLAPMLVGLLTFLPILIPMLFKSEFLPVVPMAQVAVLAMYLKVLTMPVAYITLARHRSLAFLFLESSYFVVLIVAIMLGYQWWGIFGTGIAIVVAHVVECMLTMVYAYRYYDYRSTWAIARYAGVQMAIGFTAYAVSLLFEGWLYWTIEAALTIVSTAYSISVLRQKTHLWERLKQRIRI